MPIIRIIKCTADELIIQPIQNPSKYRYCISHDLSIDFADLKKYLISQELIENVDYELVKADAYEHPRYQIRFSGKSLVLRAMHTIPREQIEFGNSSGMVSQEKYSRDTLRYATLISPKSCLVHDVKFVEKAFQEIFNYLKEQINKIHSKYIGKPSSIITQLNTDLSIIENMQNENIFVNPKYLLLAGSLMVSLDNEKEKKSIVAPYSLFKGNSILAPDYDTLLSTTREHFAPALAQYPKSQLMESYNKYVLASQPSPTHVRPAVVAVSANSLAMR